MLRREDDCGFLTSNGDQLRAIGGGKAYYSPGTDHIQLPSHEAFTGPEAWAATALHELGHWTGHRSRLNRDLSGRFGSAAYAQEELAQSTQQPNGDSPALKESLHSQ